MHRVKPSLPVHAPKPAKKEKYIYKYAVNAQLSGRKSDPTIVRWLTAEPPDRAAPATWLQPVALYDFQLP